MQPSEKRKRLFSKSKPYIREATKDDMWLLWAAYDLGSFPNIKEGLSKEEFMGIVSAALAGFSNVWLVEDDCKWFKSKRGPIAMVAIKSNGWTIEPHVDFFKWASPRNKLRGNVQFFQKVRYDKGVGACVVHSLKETKNIFDRMAEYGVLFYVGKVPNGDPRGDDYIYSIRGKLCITEQSTSLDSKSE